jgi:hypothetical protein
MVGGLVVVLRFRSDDAQRACCDLAYMRKTWGPDAARVISRRLQQLEAMTTLADLSYLPFDSREYRGRVIEVAITGHLALFIEAGPETSGEGAPMTIITITGVRDRAAMARTP